MSLPAVSKHLRVLERAGLIRQRREAQFRVFRLEPAPLKAVSNWTEHYRQLWEARLDRLETYIHEMKTQQKEKKHARKQPGQSRDV